MPTPNIIDNPAYADLFRKTLLKPDIRTRELIGGEVTPVKRRNIDRKMKKLEKLCLVTCDNYDKKSRENIYNVNFYRLVFAFWHYLRITFYYLQTKEGNYLLTNLSTKQIDQYAVHLEHHFQNLSVYSQKTLRKMFNKVLTISYALHFAEKDSNFRMKVYHGSDNFEMQEVDKFIVDILAADKWYELSRVE